MNKLKKTVIYSVFSFLLTMLLVSCMPHSSNPAEELVQAGPPAPLVTVTKAKTVKDSNTEEYIGNIYARDYVNIVARIQGYLKKHYFTEGQIVNKGSLLFLIEPDQYQAEVEQVLADIENIKATLLKDEKNLTRTKELVEQDYISHSAYDEALAARDQSQADLKAKEAALKKARLNLSYTKIYAPIVGKIGSLEMSEGNLVDPSTGPLATIVKLNPIYVTYKIPADNFTKLRLKLAKEGKDVSNYPIDLVLSDGTSYPYKGYLDFFDNKVDETTGTIKMRAKFPNPQGVLLPGQLCKVIVYSAKPTLKQIIPQSSVLEDTAGKYVYLVDENNKVYRQSVEVGKQIGKYWVLKEGLKPEDEIIISGIQKVRPGIKVKMDSTTLNNNNDEGKN